MPVDEATRDDFVSEVFLVLIRHDFAALRRFRRQCSLATYLTVVARRVVVRRLQQIQRANIVAASPAANHAVTNGHTAVNGDAEIQRIENVEEVQFLMTRLDPREANVIRMYHLEGKSYQEISQVVGVSENSIGPLLHRARKKMNPN